MWLGRTIARKGQICRSDTALVWRETLKSCATARLRSCALVKGRYSQLVSRRTQPAQRANEQRARSILDAQSSAKGLRSQGAECGKFKVANPYFRYMLSRRYFVVTSEMSSSVRMRCCRAFQDFSLRSARKARRCYSSDFGVYKRDQHRGLTG